MSEFEGGKVKVRCVDCTKLSGSRCSLKGSKVSAKKRRTCSKYDFKGEFSNRVSPDAVYLPYVDPKSRRILNKLMKLGLTSSSNKSPIPPPPDMSSIDPNMIINPAYFQSTATANIPVVSPLESVGHRTSSSDSDQDIDGANLIWSPGDEKSE